MSVSNTSATNGDSQPQQLCDMPMNSYLRQIPPLSSLLGKSTPLDMIGLFKPLPRQSGPYADHSSYPARQFGAALGPSRGTPVIANTTRQSGITIGQSGLASNRLATWARLSRYTCAEPTIAHHTPIYYTPQQQYVPPHTYLNHNAPYDHRSVNVLNRSRQEGRHNNARPNKPHSLGSVGLPPSAMEKIR
jgi:hypothetical protein